MPRIAAGQDIEPHIENLERRELLSSAPIITEFMAINDSTLADADVDVDVSELD